jgi:anti-sigma regulatory factor (Ser/Thr protein kinase)
LTLVGRVQQEDLSATYDAVPWSVPVARRAVAEVAANAGVSGERLDAIRLAVSEAVTNVVKYGYGRRLGQVHVTAAVAGGELCVVVADEGCGIHPQAGGRGLGLGLMLIAEACDQVTIVKRAERGIELWMWLRLDAEAVTSSDQSRGSDASATVPAWSRFSTTV